MHSHALSIDIDSTRRSRRTAYSETAYSDSYRRDMPATAHPIQISMTIHSRLPRGAMAMEMRDMPATEHGSSIVNYHSAAKGLRRPG